MMEGQVDPEKIRKVPEDTEKGNQEALINIRKVEQ
jgi:hypothetical protein